MNLIDNTFAQLEEHLRTDGYTEANIVLQTVYILRDAVNSALNEPRERRAEPSRISDITRTANNVFDKSEGANGRGPHWF